MARRNPITLMIAGDGKTTTIEGAADPGEVRAWLDAQKGRPAPAK
jgi:hypothetical protein